MLLTAAILFLVSCGDGNTEKVPSGASSVSGNTESAFSSVQPDPEEGDASESMQSSQQSAISESDTHSINDSGQNGTSSQSNGVTAPDNTGTGYNGYS